MPPSQDTSTPPRSMDDLSSVDLDDVLHQARTRLGRDLVGAAAHYGRVNGTAGFRTDAGTWVRLSWRRNTRLDPSAWLGTEAAAAAISDSVPRPGWIAAATWSDPDRGVVWRAEETTLAPAPALSTTGEITTDTPLHGQWWNALVTALEALAAHTTDRTALDHAHLTRRIHEVYGTRIDSRIPDNEWACAHGDLGYANLTGPELMLLDWESWGMAPIGWDAACLWSASLRVPHIADEVLQRFEAALSTRSGRLCRLLLCANVAHATRRLGRELPATGAAAAAAETLLDDLARTP
ncbi:protein kinase family protein [Streptomonospora wellingtoniae]|uniref:Aminoglycoside phosphotransferase n=1 Tax=Streptomonospora wellingtoniae TaxID=3075544 RepID=A0ABU2KW73_9ACTN|nr:aminoglycoside phosphotransferase [Streptomonospora sp. DSM 45055]MDT0303542.1 aminoglycoside phosphotransferase [Streptomonospora sp. DSM 45055]